MLELLTYMAAACVMLVALGAALQWLWSDLQAGVLLGYWHSWAVLGLLVAALLGGVFLWGHAPVTVQPAPVEAAPAKAPAPTA